MSAGPLLSWIVFLPLLGLPLLAAVPAGRPALARRVAIVVSLLPLAVSLFLFTRFDSAAAGFQFVESAHWFSLAGIEIRYILGVDGISVFMVLLTAFLTPVAIAASKGVERHVRSFLACLLLLETGIFGVFLALDLALFYVFWEVALIPMALLIGVWGSARRVYAMVKFFLYTMAGSLAMLAGLIALAWLHYDATGVGTFSYLDIAGSLQASAAIPLMIPLDRQILLFLAFGIAFAIKVPLFPFHTWLPDAHTEAPTAGSVILAGVLLKMGTYGFLRFCLPLFPEASAALAPWIRLLAAVGIVYGALVAMVQPDLKRLVAYSSVSHMGLVVLGIFAFNAPGSLGANVQMLNHGLSTGMLFLLVGMLYDRRHTRLIADFGGLAKAMPAYATFFMLALLASIGLPGLNGFVGEILVLLGVFPGNPALAVVVSLGMILSAAYMLIAYQKVFFGEATREENRVVADIGRTEKLLLAPFVVLMVWIGLYSAFFLRPAEPSLRAAVQGAATAEKQIGPWKPPRVRPTGPPAALFPSARDGAATAAAEKP